MKRYLTAVVVTGAALLGACGGGDGEPATFVALLEPFQEAASFQRLKAEMASRNVMALGFKCGYSDLGKLPEDQRALWVGGRTPRFLLVAVGAADVDTARSMSFPGFATVAAEPYVAVHTDPFDCDPEVEVFKGPFGGIG